MTNYFMGPGKSQRVTTRMTSSRRAHMLDRDTVTVQFGNMKDAQKNQIK